MPRVKRGVPAHKRHKKVLGLTKGTLGCQASSLSDRSTVDAPFARLCLS